MGFAVVNIKTCGVGWREPRNQTDEELIIHGSDTPFFCIEIVEIKNTNYLII